MPDALPISVPIIASNEAHNLGRCLASVRDWVDDIVVVINDCTDNTREVAQQYGATVVEHPWQGYGKQKQLAVSLTRHDWQLALDADEEVSPELKQSIFNFFQGDHERYGGAYVARKVWFLGQWMKHGDLYPDYSLRLFRRDVGMWSDAILHESVALQSKGKKLQGDLHHYSYPSINVLIHKINVFADCFLQQQLDANKRWSLSQTLLRPTWRFFRAYILRRGFMDGFPGLFVAVATAFQTFVRYSRVYEHERTQSHDHPSDKP